MSVKNSNKVLDSVILAAERMRKVRQRAAVAQVAAEGEPDTPSRATGAATIPGVSIQGQPKG